ncbi:MAG: prephenate dehydrogenase/arogenate dehydrogenase family protein [Candidatus Nanopelagicales bacterium]
MDRGAARSGAAGAVIVGVVGLGLIGSSAARALAPAHEVRGFDPGVADVARSWGVTPVDDITELLGCDLILLAAPTGENVRTLAILMRSGRRVPTADLGSVKEPIMAVWRRDPTFPFIGTHPMTGSERSGHEAGRVDLFAGCPWPVIVEDDVAPAALRRILEVIVELGGEALPMTAACHDRVVALASHLPHLQAGALGNVVAADPDADLVSGVAAGSFRDATRVSASPPERTAEFVTANAVPAAAAARAAAAELIRAADLLEVGDANALAGWLAVAHTVRDRLDDGSRAASVVDLSGDAALARLAAELRDSGRRIVALGPDTVTVTDDG